MKICSLSLALNIAGKLFIFSQWLAGFGIFGIFILTLLDSAFLPLAGAPDLALITFCYSNPVGTMWYILTATVGSTIGCLVLYKASQKIGKRAFNTIKLERRQKIERLLVRFDIIAITVAAILPPPVPFKPFIICASAIHLKTWRLVVGLFLGRGIRYGLLGYLAVYYGKQAGNIIKQNSLWIFLILAVIVIVILCSHYLKSSKTITSIQQASN